MAKKYTEIVSACIHCPNVYMSRPSCANFDTGEWTCRIMGRQILLNVTDIPSWCPLEDAEEE